MRYVYYFFTSVAIGFPLLINLSKIKQKAVLSTSKRKQILNTHLVFVY